MIKTEKIPVILLLSLFIFMAFINFLKKDQDKKNLDELSTKTFGTIKQYDTYSKSRGFRSFGNNYYHEMIIEYEINGTNYSIHETYRGARKYNIEVGDNIYIVYNENKPEKIVPEFIKEWQIDYDSDWQKQNIIQIIMLIVLMIIYYNRNEYETN